MSKRVVLLCIAVVLGAALLISASKRAHADGKPEATKVAAAGDADKGKEIFEQCAGCHNVDSDEKKMGPSLKGLFQHDKMMNGKKPTDATVREMINKGSKTMPAY